MGSPNLEIDPPVKKKITYMPLNNGDPIRTKVAGCSFRAGVPVEVGPNEYPVEVPIVHRKESDDGTFTTHMVNKKIPLVQLLAGNPHFEIDGIAAQAKTGRPKKPTTDREYRMFALAWLERAQTGGEIRKRWADEEPLRQQLEVGDDDVRFMMQFINARLMLLDGGGTLVSPLAAMDGD